MPCGVEIGVIGPHTDADQRRASARTRGARLLSRVLGAHEDPVTGSLNAGFAVWLTGEGTCRRRTSRGRARRWVATDACGSGPTDAGDIWVGGSCRTVVSGHVDL